MHPLKNILSRKLIKPRTLATLCLLGAASPAAQAIPLMTDYSALPPLAARNSGGTMVMLAMSLDHQLFLKAYNDYDDLSGPDGQPDGRPDMRYQATFDYTGYFDHEKCYEYKETEGVFVPSKAVVPLDVNRQACPGPVWSGNFLNWATMTRADLVRHVLYGGYRSTDTATSTILERAFLPHDAHSFAKYFVSGEGEIGDLVDESAMPVDCGATGEGSCGGLTFCSTSAPVTTWGSDVFSHSRTDAAPLLRVARGNFSFWASSERFQCLYGPTAYTNESGNWNEIPHIGEPQTGDPVQKQYEWPGHNGNDPTKTLIPAFNVPPLTGKDFIVRVSVCGKDEAPGAHTCKQYGQSSKPVGILQAYGEDKGVQFGLMTGGYKSNIDWGVLRKNIGSVADEIDPATGVFSREGRTLIGSLDALRIVDYQHFSADGGDGGYWRRGSYYQNCPWGMGSITDGCRNWGNPFSELLAESYRYFSGAAAAKVTDDGGYLENLGLGVDTWTDPLKTTTGDSLACANMNVIGFNASTVSYDADLANRSLTTDLGLPVPEGKPGLSVSNLMAGLNQVELNRKLYFVGKSGAASDGLCTPKAIADLSLASGICPEAPNQMGSFLGAGLAHYVYTNDVREGGAKNTIRTLGVTLAGNVPKIEIKVDGQDVTIVPACRNGNNDTNCAIVDFRPLSVALGAMSGTYLVNWEDSEQGGDFDTDMNGMMRYEIKGNTVTVKTKALYSSTRDPLGFGFVISGTSNDGMKILSGINNFADFGACQQQGGCNLNDNEGGYAEQTFIVLPATDGSKSKVAGFLESTLYYASKWGSFEEIDDPANPMPNLDEEWDEGNYAVVTNPGKLQKQLESVFEKLTTMDTTGSAGAAFSQNNINGEGLVAQSLYFPKLGNVKWAGMLHGLFLDQYGNYREDTNGNLKLDGADGIVVPIKDPESGLIQYERYAVDAKGNGVFDAPLGTVSADKLLTVFSAHGQLAKVADATSQRAYAIEQNERFIFTGVDATGTAGTPDGLVTSTETIEFTEDSAEALAGLLDLGPEKSAADVINYIRGAEIEGYRSRSTDYDGDGTPTPWLLGDITHSTPVLVGRPTARFDRKFNDPTYLEFAEQYRNRRQVVYVGANDGMLHAFNAGFYDHESKSYRTTASGEEGGYALGNELWGYVPYNLLPHLKWLTDPGYSHVYYMDGQVHMFDVNAFTDDADHPGGWGTILVAGMRFGGGTYEIADGATTRSGYVIMDITNPEKAPALIAEVTHPELGFTTSTPEVFKFRQYDAAGEVHNKWYLAFGSGPQGEGALQNGVSDNTAKLFYMDLRAAVGGTPSLEFKDTGAVDSFVGGVTAADWNMDMVDDALVFGTVGDGSAANKGALWQAKIKPSNSLAAVVGAPSELLSTADVNLPFMAPPIAVADTENNHWVLAGTGRFITAADLADKTQVNSYFGVKVPATGDVNPANLTNVTDYKVYRLEGTEDQFVVQTEPGADAKPLTEVQTELNAMEGWYREFPVGESNYTESLLISSTIYADTFEENNSTCEAGAQSTSYVMDMFNGLPQTRRKQLFINPDAGLVDTNGDGEADAAEVGLGDDKKTPGALVNKFASEGFLEGINTEGNESTTDTTMRPAEAAPRSWREISADEVVN